MSYRNDNDYDFRPQHDRFDDHGHCSDWDRYRWEPQHCEPRYEHHQHVDHCTPQHFWH